MGDRTAGAHPPQHGAHPGLQLGQPERLDQVVVGALVERDDPVALLGAGGDHDQRGVAAFAQAPADLQAVHVRQAEIEQHQVAGTGGQSRRTGGRGAYFVARPQQAALQGAGNTDVVLDDEHARPGGAGPDVGHGHTVTAPRSEAGAR